MPEVHVVYDDSGRILAVATAEATAGPGGLVLRHQPVPVAGQYAMRITLDDEQHAAGSVAFLREFEIDPEASPPALRRRSR